MKIGISGYFGYQNFGDEIFFKTWKQIFHDHDVIALTGYEDISELDKIIIGGGDLIVPNFFTNAYWRPNLLEKDTYVYGVGIPNNIPANKDEISKYTAFLAKCKYISFRDYWSRDFAIKNGVCGNNSVVVEDIAWAYKYPKISFYKWNDVNKNIGISIRDASILSFDNVLLLCKYILNKGYGLTIIPLQPAGRPEWNDRDINLRLASEIFKENPNAPIQFIPECFDIDNKINVISSLDMYVTERMHGMLMSLRTGQKTMTIGKSNKFHRIIEKFGLQDSLTDDSLENLIKTFDLIDEGSVDFDVTQKGIRKVEQSSLDSLLNFKNFVLNYK